MTLSEILKAVDALTLDERRQLRDYLDRHESESLRRSHFSPEQRIQMLEEASAAIREGLTQDELEQMIAAMNEEYIEPWDESEWKA